MKRACDRSKSLQQLEGEEWGEATHHSYLVQTLHHLHRKPLKDFTAEDLRICILQNISLPYLMPLAVEVLDRTVLAEGDYFPGDLLAAVLRVDGSFWSGNPDTLRRVREFLTKAKSLFPLLNDAGSDVIEASLAEAEKEFLEQTQQYG
jgi:hypothetical protein